MAGPWTSWCETHDSINSSYSRASHTSQRKYILKGSYSSIPDRSTVESTVAALSPVYDGSLIRKGWEVDRVTVKKGTSADTEVHVWNVTVNYGQERTEEIRGSTGGGTQTVTAALQHIASYAASGQQAGVFDGSINVTEDEVKGTDVKLPTFAFQIMRELAAGSITNAYLNTLSTATTCANQYSWRGFPKGSVILDHADFEMGADKDMVTFFFEHQPNLTNATFPGNITGVNKEGWQYIWFEFRKRDDANGRQILKPIAAHVERLYNYFDFSLLGV